MRMVWLMLCAGYLVSLGTPAFAQLPEPEFDPAPVSISGSSAGSLRTITSLDLLNIRQVYGVSISPDGTSVAFVVGQADYRSNSYRSGLFLADAVSHETPKCLGSAGTPHWDAIHQWIPESPQWSVNSSSLTYRMRMRATDSWQVWGWDRKSDRLSQLTRVPGDVLSYRRNDAVGKLILKVRRPADPRAAEQIEMQGIHYDDRFLPWQGVPVILASLSEQARIVETWVHDFDTGSDRKATAEEEEALQPSLGGLQQVFDADRPASSSGCQVERAQLSPDGHTVAFVCFEEDSNGTGIFSWNLFLGDLRTRSVRQVTSDVYIVTDYWWSSDGSSLYYVANQGDGRSDTIYSTDVNAVGVKAVFKDSAFLRQFSADSAGEHIACTRETNLVPAQIAIIDTQRNELRTLVDLNPEFADLRLSPAERIAGINAYGEEWFGHVIKPAGYQPGRKYPLVVTTYRSGDYFLLGASGNENPIQLYAANGFVVLSFDMGRLRSRRAHDFPNRLLDWKSPTESISEAIDMLAKSGVIDPERVGITGFSHGAEIVEYAIAHTSRFRAAVLSGPAARDPYFYYMGATTWHETFESWGLGGWPEGAAKSNWKQLAASLNADRIQTPLLVNASDSEYIASLSLYTSLQQLKKPVDMFVYAYELHIKNQPSHRYEIYERNLDWFRFWLKDEEDPSPDKASQYKYWRELREEAKRSSTTH
jgi:dipeptidyl aminopeptidase/acylaminoacyl peptidase